MVYHLSQDEVETLTLQHRFTVQERCQELWFFTRVSFELSTVIGDDPKAVKGILLFV